jgi:hypothetical protein
VDLSLSGPILRLVQQAVELCEAIPDLGTNTDHADTVPGLDGERASHTEEERGLDVLA